MDANVNFEVSDKRRAVWDAELSMVKEVQRICERHNLQYFAVYGTLLGAIRNEGFIPWDDDIDIAMFREDYEKFLEYAKTELPESIFLQTSETEEDYFFGHTKLRLNHTSAIRYVQYPENYRFHQGVFMDVFALDNVPDGKIAYAVHRKIAGWMLSLIYYAKYYYRVNYHAPAAQIKHKIVTLLLPTNRAVRRTYRIYQRWIQLPNRKNTRRCAVTSPFYHLDECIWEKSWLESTVKKPFQGIELPVPAEFDAVLKKNYGDYMRPVQEPSAHGGGILYDFEHDYRDYYNGKRSFTKED